MKPRGPIARWRTWLRAIRGQGATVTILRQPDQDRLRQMAASRAAFLSDQSASGRALASPDFGDIR